MSSTIVIGSQWGDEGKGKLVDYLASRADIVARFQGGANAGHTVVVDGEEFILHQIPSGIIYPQPECVIGNGVVINPDTFAAEKQELESRGISTEGRIKISGKAHLLLEYHRVLDQQREIVRGKGKLGTTGRGIGPAYQDKAARTGVRVMDFHQPDVLRKKVIDNTKAKNKILQALGSEVTLDPEKIAEELMAHRDSFLAMESDVSLYMHQALKTGKRILLEGAQGCLLDVDHGTYPFVTSSNTSIGGALAGLGIGLKAIDTVLGVVKAYTTRVGSGPLPTELKGEQGDRLRELGQEYGATTGRPRRCGWFDAVVTRYSKRINGLTHLAVTKLDVLDSIEEVKICNAYRYRGQTLTEFPSNMEVLGECEPIYKSHPGWVCVTRGITGYEDLPKFAQSYLGRISEIMDCPIRLVSVGAQRDQIIDCSDG